MTALKCFVLHCGYTLYEFKFHMVFGIRVLHHKSIRCFKTENSR